MQLLDFDRRRSTVRGATSLDAEGIARVQHDAWHRAYRAIVPNEVLDGLAIRELSSGWSRWLAEDAENSRTTWVAERRGEIVGFASIGPTRDLDASPTAVGELYAFYVHPSVWRHGIGTRLHEQAVGELSARRFVDATLWVLEQNLIGRRFYEAHGWTVQGGIKGCFDGRTPAIRYERSLARNG